VNHATEAGKLSQAERIAPTGPWQGPSLMLLDHLNTADIVLGPLVEGDVATTFAQWMSEIRSGSPFVAWRERLVEANRSLNIHGEYAQAAVLAQTAAEVLLDTLLMLPLWEEKLPAENAATILEEGKLARRIKTEWQPRLGGNWSLDSSGSVATWFLGTALLRNRVVHGGYLPTRAEARCAYEAVFSLEKFAFDRLVDKRNRYPRSVLMTVARSGLERRGRWSGQIKRFAETIAGTEPSWRDSFREYRAAVAAARD